MEKDIEELIDDEFVIKTSDGKIHGGFRELELPKEGYDIEEGPYPVPSSSWADERER